MKEDNRQPRRKNRDISSKRVLENPVLYSQFLRNNVEIPCLKNKGAQDGLFI